MTKLKESKEKGYRYITKDALMGIRWLRWRLVQDGSISLIYLALCPPTRWEELSEGLYTLLCFLMFWCKPFFLVLNHLIKSSLNHFWWSFFCAKRKDLRFVDFNSSLKGLAYTSIGMICWLLLSSLTFLSSLWSSTRFIPIFLLFFSFFLACPVFWRHPLR